MKIFGIELWPDEPSSARITVIDRGWVDYSNEWLITVFGYPDYDQISLNAEHFPNTFQKEKFHPQNVIRDCCNHLSLDEDLFSLQIFTDLRDLKNFPIAVEHGSEDIFLEYDEEIRKFHFHISNSILQHEEWVVSLICYHMIYAKLKICQLDFETGEDVPYFLYLAGVFFGYGLIFADNLIVTGRKVEGGWQSKWFYNSKIQFPVLAYALAAYSNIKTDQNNSWALQLKADMKKEYEKCLILIDKDPAPIYDKEKLKTGQQLNELLKLEYDLSGTNRFEEYIDVSKKLIFLLDDDNRKSTIWNNIGYARLRLGKFEQSISAFENAIKLDPEYGYALNNLGFALIMTDNLDEGLKYIEKAIQTGNDHPGYINRNLGLYYQKKNWNEKAEECFKKAFNTWGDVDLLEYYYGKFLIENGRQEEGIKFIKTSASKGELEGYELLEKLNIPG